MLSFDATQQFYNFFLILLVEYLSIGTIEFNKNKHVAPQLTCVFVFHSLNPDTERQFMLMSV